MLSLMPKDLTRAARWFHALSDETRLQIIERLSDGEQCVCDLTDMLATTQSLLSFHLKTLKEAGILTDRREGRWVYYSLSLEAIEDLQRFIGSLKPRGRGLRVSSKRCD
ncbi:transcriptional regulator [Candidatus Methylomirabilis limnetica]|uniref:Transcriptional regulator n=1 Tax=Candidatus Methylomirabilis limnetica TaxID=2033718 RepID=A0A2T4TZ07_9BACT|nr:metalloregulator ArsR/SmtB family transcription factor [Candidatus Methylomirabilis limnetica]PTL36342.1 transcriptional regulator [Candidatus Methylomirabilis limnetica]